MSVVSEQTKRSAALRAFLTIVLVTALVAAALGGATYVASRAFVSLLS
ncbi:hypothetical protein GCM10009795_007230 [Nocardioides hankookensis]|uniref:Uncharacterized protein n=1 Tax=Nocardioides hankookensis TaxID=443157 RepID=A0ABW1LHR7_9ACTN